MQAWLLFHRDLGPHVPEAAEILRFQADAERAGIELSVLKPQDFDLIVESGGDWSAHYRGRKLPKPDIIIPRTGSETSYLALAVLRHFERQGVAMVNGPSAIEAVADKLHTMQILATSGFPIPKTILGKFPVDVGIVERELGFPVVVKTLKGTRGSGVLLCQDREQFGDLANLLDGASPGADFIFQEYIKDSHGRDVRVLVVDGKAAAAMERRAPAGGFKSNISLGGHGSPFAIPESMATLAVDVTRSLGLDVAGIDILFDGDGYRVCEANSSPGFEGLEKACRIRVPEVIYGSVRARLGISLPQKGTRKKSAWRPIRRLIGWLSGR